MKSWLALTPLETDIILNNKNKEYYNDVRFILRNNFLWLIDIFSLTILNISLIIYSNNF